MRRFLSYCMSFLTIIASVQPSFAQESGITAYEMFGVPDEVIKVIEAPKFEEKVVSVNLPDCNDEIILQQTKQHLSNANKGESTSVISYRKQKLALKYIGDFTDVDMTSFKPSQNYLLAEEVFNLKNRKKLSSSEIRVCASVNKYSNEPLYTIMHKDKQNIKVILLSGSYKTAFSVLD